MRRTRTSRKAGSPQRVGEKSSMTPSLSRDGVPSNERAAHSMSSKRGRVLVLRTLTSVVIVVLFIASWLSAKSSQPLISLTCGAIGSLVIISLAAWSLVEGLFATVTVHGNSMEPTFHDLDRVMVRRWFRLRIGQVVVVEQPADGAAWPLAPIAASAGSRELTDRRWMIKRIAALPGDPLPDGFGSEFIDLSKERVPAGRVVLLGDNSAASLDSRQLGYFPVERVLGVVLHSRQPELE
jgi:signal peptidase I